MDSASDSPIHFRETRRKVRTVKKTKKPINAPRKRRNRYQLALAKWKRFPEYQIPQEKLNKALRFLEGKNNTRRHNRCHGNIGDQLSLVKRAVPHAHVTHHMLEMARTCATRGQWEELFQLVRLHCDNASTYDVMAVMRNALYAILADPSLADRKHLEAFLYANPICKEPADIEYCINKIIEVFQGVNIPIKRNSSVPEPASSSRSRNL